MRTLGEGTRLGATAVAGYCLVTVATEPVFIGDAPDYAGHIANWANGLNCQFLEFGHLWWRPLVYGLMLATGQSESASDPLSVLQVMRAIAWISGLVGVVAGGLWVRRIIGSYGAAVFAVAVLILSKSYLNYTQVGTSYLAGLALLLSALLLGDVAVTAQRGRVLAAAGAGVLLAGAVGMWAPFVLAAPAVVLAPLVMRGWSRDRVTTGVIVAAVSGLTLTGVWLYVGNALGFNSVDDYRDWATGASHGITTGGLPRAVIGLARSFVDLGDLGPLVKRYLVQDPYNPVALGDLFSIELLGMVVFYLVCAVALFFAARSRAQRPAVILALICAAPVALFAVVWQGGDLERYLPATPGILALVAAAWQGADGARWGRPILGVSVALMALANARVMWTGVVHGTQQEALARLPAPTPDRARDLYIVSHWQDDLWQTVRNFPWLPVVRTGPEVYPLLTPGSATAATWRESLALRVARTWGNNGEVYVSSRLLAERPSPDWRWVEGDDPTVRWHHMRDAFRGLELGDRTQVRGEFRRLLPTGHNRAALELDQDDGQQALPVGGLVRRCPVRPRAFATR